MSFNLRNRSLLTVQDFTQREFQLPARSRPRPEARQVRPHRAAAPEGQGDRADLREDLDAHALRLRGRLPRPGRARHLSRSVRLADRPQGVGQGHGPRAGAHVRRDRVPRLLAGGGRRPAEIRRRAGLQRPDRRIPPDADARRRDDHARAQRQAGARDQVRLSRRHALEHGPFADDRRLPDGHGRAHLRAAARSGRPTTTSRSPATSRRSPAPS